MSSILRFDPFRELESLQDELGRVLGSRESGRQEWLPPVDVWETDDAVVYAFDLPGVSQDKISLELDENVLTVTAERERQTKQDKDRYYRFERRFGTFTRSITLPQGIAEEDISADYSDGVLEIRVAKPKAPEPRRIQIGGKSETQTVEGTATQK